MSRKDLKVEWKVGDPNKVEYSVQYNNSDKVEAHYRIIIYITTGKILIQGKYFEQWCDDEFQKCRELISSWTTEGEITDIEIADDKRADKERGDSERLADYTRAEKERGDSERLADDKRADKESVNSERADKRADVKGADDERADNEIVDNEIVDDERADDKSADDKRANDKRANDHERVDKERGDGKKAVVKRADNERAEDDNDTEGVVDDIFPAEILDAVKVTGTNNEAGTKTTEDEHPSCTHPDPFSDATTEPKCTEFLDVFSNRLNTMESSIVQLTKTLSQVIAQHDISNENQTKLIEKLQVTQCNHQTNQNTNNTTLEKLLKEKDKECETLRKQMKQIEQSSGSEMRKAKEEQKRECDRLNSTIQNLRAEKVSVEIENERLLALIQANDQNREDLKTSWEARIKDKDIIIGNMQEQISNTVNGNKDEPWETVHNNRRSYSNVTQNTRPYPTGEKNQPTKTG